MPVGHLLIQIPAGSAELGCFIPTGDVPEGLLRVEMCLEGTQECWKMQGRADNRKVQGNAPGDDFPCIWRVGP